MAVVGPTASGKSQVAMELARRGGRSPVEIVSVDSMQVYRGMDIGTAKPTSAEREAIRHHLVDVADPSEEFSVSRYQAGAAAALAEVAERPARALLVGGTGLYLRAVVDELEIPGQWPEVRAALEEEADRGGVPALHDRLAALDPTAAGRMLATNRRRVLRALEVCIGSGRPFSSYGPGLEAYPPRPVRIFGLEVERAELDERIARRYERQMAVGFLDEVAALAARPAGLSRTARQALGYRELLAHLAGRLGREEAVAEAVRRTRSFARRQQAWFRRDPRVEWVPAGGAEGPGKAVAAIAAGLGDWWG
ncbi:MAG TPA: tRNA (adenosine(37)-N6)-dimethylallyltransferase MiaA [Acidimicrobiales bacterium]|nr:tRNA (adenosine(37)-N6)-dimethylallyltransferase MiaA [Acidimicrobiales bacterium]